jgi:hypothetical protein
MERGRHPSGVRCYFVCFPVVIARGLARPPATSRHPYGMLGEMECVRESAGLGLSASRGSAGEREYIASRARDCWEGWQAHSVR